MNERKSNRAETAQSMVEFAISLIVILLLLAAVVDFGRAFLAYISMRDAAQEGAFYASICPADTTAIDKRVRQTSQKPVPLTNTTDVKVKCYYSIGGGGYEACSSALASTLQPGRDMVKIEVVYEKFEITTPIIGSFFGSQTITLRADAVDHVLRKVTSPPTPPCGP